MNTTEKLNKIRAKCVELLAIAEKRTPGEWKTKGVNLIGHHRVSLTGDNQKAVLSESEFDALFIASCAGPAEAGWKATIAAIDSLIKERDSRAPFSEDAGNGLSLILAAWEGIL